MKLLAVFLLTLIAIQGFATEASTAQTGAQLRQERLQEEANQIIHPAPMTTQHREGIKSVEGSSYPPMKSKSFVMGGADKKPAQKAKKPKNKSSSKKSVGKNKAMTYYKALLKCKKGTYEFNNPFNTALKGHSTISNKIIGQKMGLCQVNIQFSGQSVKQQCLFSAKNLKALAGQKATAAFKNTYVKGHYDQHHLSPYDEMLSSVCLLSSTPILHS